jgi:hypothetical protein
MRHASILLFLAGVCAATAAFGQNLRYDNYREVAVPEYATLRIGPFYSTARFSLSAGYRYVETDGTGTDFLFGNERGKILEDGSDLPVIAWLDLRNYLVISRRADLDLSVTLGYETYPLDTQEDGFFLYPPEEGLSGTLTSELDLSRTVKARLYDNLLYRTDYIDERGLADEYGGEEYERFENTIGADIDWMAAKDHNLGFSLSRTDVIPREDAFERQERVSYHESVLYERRLNPQWMAGMRAGFEQNAYPATNRSDTYAQEFAAYTELELTRRSRIGGSLGYASGTISDPVGGEDDTFDTVIGGAFIETDLSKSLTHALAYTRSQDVGFESSFENSSALTYTLEWAGRFSAAQFRTGYADVEVSDRRGDYTDWVTGVVYQHPLTSWIVLELSTLYAVRENNPPPDPAGLAVTEVDDYDTWSSRIGTAFGVTRDVEFKTYAQHTERFSDNLELEYERNLLSAMFTYTREF